jgi:hypothetical protein
MIGRFCGMNRGHAVALRPAGDFALRKDTAETRARQPALQTGSGGIAGFGREQEEVKGRSG